jgi:hypothetical protein
VTQLAGTNEYITKFENALLNVRFTLHVEGNIIAVLTNWLKAFFPAVGLNFGSPKFIAFACIRKNEHSHSNCIQRKLCSYQGVVGYSYDPLRFQIRLNMQVFKDLSLDCGNLFKFMDVINDYASTLSPVFSKKVGESDASVKRLTSRRGASAFPAD